MNKDCKFKIFSLPSFHQLKQGTATRTLNGDQKMIIIKKAIEIAGWLSDREIGKGQTALWTGSGIEETCEISDGYYFEDDEIEYELAEAQKYADAMIAHNNWPITVTARINEYEFDTADFE